MIGRRTVSAILASILFMGPCSGFAAFQQGGSQQGNDARMEKARKLVDGRLSKLSVQAQAVIPISVQFIRASFPNDFLFAVRFRLYPVAVLPPEPLKSQNIIAVNGEVVTDLTSIPIMESWFRRNYLPAADPVRQKQAVRTWLSLSAELKQDGFYTFEINENGIAISRRQGMTWVSGKASVTGGGTGEIRATLVFDNAGKIDRIEETSTVKPGVRPICQATKLLDKDPIVRKMAEQDILVMGRAAKPYLDEQRAKRTPKLKNAIDKIWHRIVVEDR
jgi:hypothetical protein